MKRSVYLVLTTVLGVITSFGVHAAVEYSYLSWTDRAGRTVHWYPQLGGGLCALNPIVEYGLLAAGLVGGFIVGRVWWRIVYIEHRRWMKKR